MGVGGAGGVGAGGVGQRGGSASFGMLDGGRGSSKASGPPTPSDDTFNGKSAPQAPGPLIGSIRTLPAPSLTEPEVKHAISASLRQDSRSPKNRPLQPANTASEPRTTELTRYQRTSLTIVWRMRRIPLTPHQRF